MSLALWCPKCREWLGRGLDHEEADHQWRVHRDRHRLTDMLDRAAVALFAAHPDLRDMNFALDQWYPV